MAFRFWKIAVMDQISQMITRFRLTLLYTPGVTRSDIHQGTQDWGIQDVRYGIYGHSGNWRQAQSQWQGMFFNQPLIPFEAAAHNGTMGRSVSFLKTSSPAIGVMAFKKMKTANITCYA